ncbi:antibiotic biosynthesis monooxygenase [Bosea sp. Root483D1]|uniref:putative quinol monooxygenase n=1 Tax=Bosea sp. Root483D1 TaxID=1736544 RepID=UPI00070CBED8|nr:antibiotic biosynthesis monooxygenase [Bosea sp. Root483D1]KRE11589.1 antibiotic biosynthesis monooxygenase [Bosea sp. Root483D1]
MDMINRRTMTSMLAVLLSGGASLAQDKKSPVVRIADLDIDPAHLDSYTAIVREEMETSVRVEPGVIAIYAVADKERPSRLRFLEIYVDDEAYRAHIASSHFRTYFEATTSMILDRKLIEAVPVQLSSKSR